MSETWNNWLEHFHSLKTWQDFEKIVNYPLLNLGDSPLTLSIIVKLLVVLGLVIVVEKYLRSMLRKRLLSRTHLSPDLQYAVSRFVGYCFIALGFFFAFKMVHLDLSALAVIVGGLGIGVGLGLQNVISNFVSGLIILAERPIAIGHRIEVGEVAGQVTRINLRSTVVLTNDNITIIVPNSNFITNSITNWSYGDPKVRIRLPVGVAYGSDVEKMVRVLTDVAKANSSVLQEPAPSVLFLGFGDSSLNFELAVWTLDMALRPLKFKSDLFFAMERELRKNEIEIPFPQRDLHVRSGSLMVEMKKDQPPKAADDKPADVKQS